MSASGQKPLAPLAPRSKIGKLTLDVLWLALAGATLAALVHVAVVEVTFRLFNTLTFNGRNFAWLSLSGYLVIFLLAVPPASALALLTRRRLGERLAVFFIGSMTFLSLTLHLPRIHPAAQLALVIGLAAQTSIIVGRDPSKWMGRIRRATLSGVALLLCIGAATDASRRYAEWRSVNALPAARAGAPNVILLILDTVRAANVSAYGYGRRTTPSLEQLALEGTLFEHAFSVAPWSAPSHASMLTGLYGSQTEAGYLYPMTTTATTVAEVLLDGGYVTGAFMGNFVYAGHQVGLGRGFSHYEDYPTTLRQALWSTMLTQTGSGARILRAVFDRQWRRLRNALTHPSLRMERVRVFERSNAEEIAQNFLAWRDGVDRNRPYFAVLNFFDAHSPYESPSGYRSRFGPRTVDRYDGAIAYMDSVIGALVEDLRARGDLDRTAIIVTADHGELWGEHGMLAHGNSLYAPLLHVPLIVRAPGRLPAATRISTTVSLRDIAATLVDLGGSPGRLPGASLAAIARGEGEASPVLADATPGINPNAKNLTRFGAIHSSLDARWKYIRYGNRTEELFDWRADPAEASNLIATPEGFAEAARHRRLLEDVFRVSLTPAPAPPHSQ